MNDGFVYRERLGAHTSGRLDTYLSTRYRHSTLAQWRAHIREGRVHLDGVAANVDAAVAPGQRLTWHRPPWEEPPAPLACPTLYDDGDVLVVHKPAGLPTLPGGGFLQHTLVHHVAAWGAAPLHRLGRWTSGALLCARSGPARARLTAAFKDRRVHKRYRALASGRAATESFEVSVPIGPVAYPLLGTVHAASSRGRPAQSSVQVVRQDEQSFVCDVIIASGRPHQIRIHLASAGHPLVGDPLYGPGGGPIPGGTAVPGDPGYLLHAAEIGFDHPVTGQRIRVTDDRLPTALTGDA